MQKKNTMYFPQGKRENRRDKSTLGKRLELVDYVKYVESKKNTALFSASSVWSKFNAISLDHFDKANIDYSSFWMLYGTNNGSGNKWTILEPSVIRDMTFVFDAIRTYKNDVNTIVLRLTNIGKIIPNLEQLVNSGSPAMNKDDTMFVGDFVNWCGHLFSSINPQCYAPYVSEKDLKTYSNFAFTYAKWTEAQRSKVFGINAFISGTEGSYAYFAPLYLAQVLGKIIKNYDAISKSPTYPNPIVVQNCLISYYFYKATEMILAIFMKYGYEIKTIKTLSPDPPKKLKIIAKKEAAILAQQAQDDMATDTVSEEELRELYGDELVDQMLGNEGKPKESSGNGLLYLVGAAVVATAGYVIWKKKKGR